MYIPRMLVFALLFSCCRPTEDPKMYETSMNFDLENVGPFLDQLENRLHLGLPVADLVMFTRSTAVESENTRTLSVKYRGEVTRLDYRVFMDDIDAPDLYFGTSSKELSEAIDAELRQFADERGL